MKTEKALTRARALIEDPADWCQGAFKNERGQYCALGAIAQVTRRVRSRTYQETVDALASVLPPPAMGSRERIMRFNDQSNDLERHACVIAAFDAAIEREKQRAG